MSYIQLISVCVVTLFSLQVVLCPIEAARYELKAGDPSLRTMQVVLTDPSQQLEAQGSTAQTSLPMTKYVTEGSNPGLQRTTFKDLNLDERRIGLVGSAFKKERLRKGSPPAPRGAPTHNPHNPHGR